MGECGKEPFLVPIPSNADDQPERKTLKVRVPAEHQVRLHTLKVLTGKTMSKAVEEALSIYFEEGALEAEEPEH